MLPVFILDPNPSDIVIDMCAAPGGKATIIVTIINKIFDEFLTIKPCSNFKKILSINGGIQIKIKSRYKRELLRIK